jgi:hypothetical protein
VLAGLLVLTTLSAPLPSFAWETTFDAGSPTDDYWNAVTTDHAGNVVAAGVGLASGFDYACVFAVEKLSRATGASLWRYQTPDCGYDEVFESSGGEQVVIDPDGDVIIGRRDIGERAFGVYKLAGATGALLWSARPGFYPKHGPFVHAIALDPQGNVVIAAGFGSYSSVCRTDFVVAKLDAKTGTEIWRHTLRGTFVPTDDCEDPAFNQAQSIAVDRAGDVLVGGQLVNEGTPYPEHRSVVLKLSGSDGAELWRRDRRTIPDPGTSIAADTRGDVLSTSTDVSGLGSSARFVVTVEKRAGGNGRLVWGASVVTDGFDWPTLLALDGPNDVTMAQAAHTSVGVSVTVAKIDATSGAVRWRRQLTASLSQLRWRRESGLGLEWPLSPLAMGSDAAGNVVLGGAFQQPGHAADTVSDVFVAKLAARNGAELWHYTLDGPAHLTDEVRALAIDGGSVIAAGSWEDATTHADALTLLLDGRSGGKIWRAGSAGRAFAYGSARAVVIDAADDVVAAGYENGIGGSSWGSFTVKKLAGASGRIIWSHIDGLLEPATDVAVDGAGDIVATAAVSAIKLAGADGTSLWRYTLSRHVEPAALDVDADGSVFFAGIQPLQGPWATTVVKLSGSHGHELWRAVVDAHRLGSLVADEAGDVVLAAASTTDVEAPRSASLIVKFSGTGGAELWRVPGPGDPPAPAIDTAGDVLATGQFADGTELRSGALKIDGASGAERWRTLLGDGIAVAVTADRAGDVLTVRSIYPMDPHHGTAAGELVVSKLVGATGEVVWEQRVTEGCGAADLATDAAGDVFIAACPTAEARSEMRFATIKLAGADGAVLWQREIGGTAAADGSGVSSLAVDANGHVTVAGALATVKTALDFAVVRWDGATGGACCSVPCRPGEPCSDGDPCTDDDACVGGRCVGASPACDDGNVCTDDTCGACCPVPCRPGEPCDDGNACTEDDACVGGRCVGASPTCDDGNVCTDDTCAPAAGCTHAFNTAPCLSDDPCMAAGQCLGGACEPVAADAADVVCAMKALLAAPCGEGEELPGRLRDAIRRHVKRASRYLSRAERVTARGLRHKALRLQKRADAQLEAIARRAARAAGTPKRRRQISPACRGTIERLTARHRSLIASATGF